MNHSGRLSLAIQYAIPHLRDPRICCCIAAVMMVAVSSTFFRPRSPIIPVGQPMEQALDLLQHSPSGKKLLDRVSRTAGGDMIFLIMGQTESDRLSDEKGRQVRGVTRAEFRSLGGSYRPARVTVITNADVTDSRPADIVKSIAFELENVAFCYAQRYPPSGIDSPLALVTQEKVVRELGL